MGDATTQFSSTTTPEAVAAVREHVKEQVKAGRKVRAGSPAAKPAKPAKPMKAAKPVAKPAGRARAAGKAAAKPAARASAAAAAQTAAWAQGYAVGTRVRVQVGLSAGEFGEIADVYADAHRPPVAPYRWYAVRLADGLRPLYRHDEIQADEAPALLQEF